MSNQEKFVSHIQSMIHDEDLKELVPKIFELAPEPFWFSPASSSGNHHPSFSLGEGGLVRHTVACVHVARDLAHPYGWAGRETPYGWAGRETIMDQITIAAAFHDTFKGGMGSIWGETQAGHPEIAADILRDLASLTRKSARRILYEASWGVAFHMSMWGIHPTPVSELGSLPQIITLADYLVSRKYFAPSDELATLLEEFRAI